MSDPIKAPGKHDLHGQLSPEEQEIERQRRLQVAEEARIRMEVDSARVRELVLAQPPLGLLSYLWAQFHLSVLSELRQKGDTYRPNKDLTQKFQVALEYAHAVWSAEAGLEISQAPLNEAKAAQLFEALDELMNITMGYCMASSAANAVGGRDHQSAETEFQAKTTWVLLRGNRYQVLEEEFFKFILEPHDEALITAYGMDSAAIAASLQALADSVRTGFRNAVEKMFEGMGRTYAVAQDGAADLAAAIDKVKENDPNFSADMSAAVQDILFGGLCNMSRHGKFSQALLEDLSYVPGGNLEFFADGEFKGTPMRTLPALVKPGIKLGNDYYFTDGQFVRDAAYRAIQRGLVARLPEYREEWNRRQKVVTENSFPTIFSKQLMGSKRFCEVYFKDAETGDWCETDFVVVLADVLIVVEAKAGVYPMHSPATNFKSHERTIHSLIIKAYEQGKRFVEYLASAPEVSIFQFVDGEYVEVDKLRTREFRLILPIGLTVEALTPFSAMSKELYEVQPILDKYPFVSMSVDDLFVLNRFLPTAGALFHYLEVRQAVAGVKRAMIFDEIEHLGAYIRGNRFDVTIKEQLEEADMVTWDSFGDVVDEYFEGRAWEAQTPPQQYFPEELLEIFAALERFRPSGWLAIDAFIRNLGGTGRADLAAVLEKLRLTLARFPARRLLYGTEDPLQVWVCRRGHEPTAAAIHEQAQIASLLSKGTTVRVLILSYEPSFEIVEVRCAVAGPPSVLQLNYPDLLKEAEKQRERQIKLEDTDAKQGRKGR